LTNFTNHNRKTDELEGKKDGVDVIYSNMKDDKCNSYEIKQFKSFSATNIDSPQENFDKCSTKFNLKGNSYKESALMEDFFNQALSKNKHNYHNLAWSKVLRDKGKAKRWKSFSSRFNKNRILRKKLEGEAVDFSYAGKISQLDKESFVKEPVERSAGQLSNAFVIKKRLCTITKVEKTDITDSNYYVKNVELNALNTDAKNDKNNFCEQSENSFSIRTKNILSVEKISVNKKNISKREMSSRNFSVIVEDIKKLEEEKSKKKSNNQLIKLKRHNSLTFAKNMYAKSQKVISKTTNSKLKGNTFFFDHLKKSPEGERVNSCCRKNMFFGINICSEKICKANSNNNNVLQKDYTEPLSDCNYKSLTISGKDFIEKKKKKTTINLRFMSSFRKNDKKKQNFKAKKQDEQQSVKKLINLQRDSKFNEGRYTKKEDNNCEFALKKKTLRLFLSGKVFQKKSTFTVHY
jgi:hypothetical protein